MRDTRPTVKLNRKQQEIADKVIESRPWLLKNYADAIDYVLFYWLLDGHDKQDPATEPDTKGDE
jgi:hypothetical protein